MISLTLEPQFFKDGGGVKDLKNRLSKARGAFIRLKKTWSSNSISRTKVRLYKALLVPVLLYGCETWTMNKKTIRQWMWSLTGAYEESSEFNGKSMAVLRSY